MKDYTEIVFILDRSGSMAGLESDTIGGFNSVLEKNRNSGENTVVSTVMFNHMIDVICDRKDIKDVKPLTNEDYCAHGSTALLDAVGKSIEHVSKVQKTLPKHHRAKNVLFVITTDGYENASQEYTYKKVKELIEKRTSKGWEFLFLGANIDAAAEAARIGIAADRTAQCLADSKGTKAVFGSIDAAMHQINSPVGITCSWKREIEKDTSRRARRQRAF